MSNYQNANLSQRHAGQIVRPTVSYRKLGTTQYAICWHWTDSSQPLGSAVHEYGHGEFHGDYWKCITRLKSEGIFIDDEKF